MFLSIIILVPVAALCIFMMMKWMFRMGMYGNIEYQRFGYFLILWTLARATVGKKKTNKGKTSRSNFNIVCRCYGASRTIDISC